MSDVIFATSVFQKLLLGKLFKFYEFVKDSKIRKNKTDKSSSKSQGSNIFVNKVSKLKALTKKVIKRYFGQYLVWKGKFINTATNLRP